MNQLLLNALASLVRFALAGIAGWLVQRGAWTQDAANEYMTAAAIAIVTLGWSLWSKYKSRLKFLTALESPAGTSEARVDKQIKDGAGANVIGLLLFLLVLPALACGPKSVGTNPRHPAVVASVALGEALFALDDGERALYVAGRVTPAQHKVISGPIADVLQVGRDANGAILAWRPGQKAPAALGAMLPRLKALSDHVVAALPGEPTASLLTYVSQVYAAVALVLSIMAGGA